VLNPHAKKQERCENSEFLEGVTPTGGVLAGSYTQNTDAYNKESCIRSCCNANFDKTGEKKKTTQCNLIWFFETQCFLIKTSSRHLQNAWPRKRTELKFSTSVMANVTVLEEEDKMESEEDKDEKLEKSLKIKKCVSNADCVNDETEKVFKMPDYLEGRSGSVLPEKVIMYPKRQGYTDLETGNLASSAHLSKKLQFLVEKYTTQRTLQVNKVTVNAMGMLMRNLSSDDLLKFKGGLVMKEKKV